IVLAYSVHHMLRPSPSPLCPYTTPSRSSARWRAELAGRARRYAAGDVHSATELTLRQRLRLGPDTSLRLDVVRRREAMQTTRERSEEHTSELQSRENLVCRLLLEKKKKT